MNAKVMLSGLAILALAGTGVAAGPTSTLYLTAGDQFRNVEVLAGTTTGIVSVQNENTGRGEYAIAVSGGTVRTAGNGQFGAPALGSAYDLNFNYIGPRLANPLRNILDGTTDGRYNYGVDFVSGAVYRCNLDWSSPTFMFYATPHSSSDPFLGISFDPFNNSLWITEGGYTVADYSMSGARLSSFITPGSYDFALAFDGADGTLWAMTDFNTGVFNQYSTSGTLLQSINLGTTFNFIGGEFALVPEPATLSLLTLAILGIALKRRRQTFQFFCSPSGSGKVGS